MGNKLEIKIAGGVEGTHAVILSLVARQAELNSSCYSVRFKSGLFSKAKPLPFKKGESEFVLHRRRNTLAQIALEDHLRVTAYCTVSHGH